jgi:hypothetical protein
MQDFLHVSAVGLSQVPAHTNFAFVSLIILCCVCIGAMGRDARGKCCAQIQPRACKQLDVSSCVRQSALSLRLRESDLNGCRSFV